MKKRTLPKDAPKKQFLKWNEPSDDSNGYWTTFNSIDDCFDEDDFVVEVYEARIRPIGVYRKGVYKV